HRTRPPARACVHSERFQRAEHPSRSAGSPLHLGGIRRRTERRIPRLESDPAAREPELSVTRWLIGAGLLVAMVAFGVGVYHAAGYLKGQRNVVHRPTEVSAPSLPGTLFVVQKGAIYRFEHGRFTQITSESGWMMPGPAPNNQLVAARRQG